MIWQQNGEKMLATILVPMPAHFRLYCVSLSLKFSKLNSIFLMKYIFEHTKNGVSGEENTVNGFKWNLLRPSA